MRQRAPTGVPAVRQQAWVPFGTQPQSSESDAPTEWPAVLDSGRTRRGATSGECALCSAEHNQCDVVVRDGGTDQLVHEVARDYVGMGGRKSRAEAIQANVDWFAPTLDQAICVEGSNRAGLGRKDGRGSPADPPAPEGWIGTDRGEGGRLPGAATTGGRWPAKATVMVSYGGSLTAQATVAIVPISKCSTLRSTSSRTSSGGRSSNV